MYDIFTALADKECIDKRRGVENLRYENLALDADKIAGLRGLAAEAGAESLDAGVGAARDGWAEGHGVSLRAGVVGRAGHGVSGQR